MRASALRLGAAGAALLALAGCSEAFDPRVPDDRAFAVFGTLDGRQAVQRLRVQDLALPVSSVPEVLPASVTSTELTSGVTTVWADSLVRLADGGLDHLFTAPLALRPGEVHRIRVERLADGATSTTEVRLPTPTVALGPATPEIKIRVDLGGLVSAPPRVRVRYRARFGATEADVVVTYAVGAVLSGPSFLLDLEANAERVWAALGGGPNEVELLDAVLEAEITSAAPVPIEGGVGAVGWVLPVTLPLGLLPADVEAAGLVDARGR